MRRSTILMGILVAADLLLAGPALARQAPVPHHATRDAIIGQLALARTQPLATAPRIRTAHEHARRFYESTGHAPAWEGADSALAAQALQLLRGAEEYGLNPQDYALAGTDSEAGQTAPEQAARFDLALTTALLSLLIDLHFGRSTPEFSWFGGALAPRSFDPVECLQAALRRGQLAQAVSAAEPRVALYQRLKQALAQYRALEARWRALAPLPPLPDGSALYPGMEYDGADGLRQRLVLLGDMPASLAPAGALHYGAELAAAVSRFQLRHGLQQDGVLGKATMAALAVPLSGRMRQLELSMERLRWFPPMPPGPVIVVNVPAFRLWAFDTAASSAEAPVEMRVIVGAAARTPTPLIIASMRHLEFNPAWNVPRSIALKEIVPKLQRDPDYLRKHDMELVYASGNPGAATDGLPTALQSGKLRIRQRPGARNVLGAVKFAMPNPMNIYLHATSAQELFARPRRDLSHGCIRLEQPALLAEFVLRTTPNWDRATILRAMEPGATRTVMLARPVPVVLLYATAVVDRQGRALFSQDIYGLDQRLSRALAGL